MILISIIELEKKMQHTHAHRLLRECLKPLGVDYDDNTPLSYGKHGKPYLAEHSDIYYNVSHADGICACITDKSECGIDCERVRPYRKNILRRILSEKEQLMLEEVPESERDLLFFRLWTLKEAYIKAIGIGLSFPMSKAEFSFDGKKVISSVKGYSFAQYIIRNEFVVSVCRKIIG